MLILLDEIETVGTIWAMATITPNFVLQGCPPGIVIIERHCTVDWVEVVLTFTHGGWLLQGRIVWSEILHGVLSKNNQPGFLEWFNLQLTNQIWAPLGFSNFLQKLLKSAGSHVICRKWLLCLLLQNKLCTVWQIKWIQSWSLKKLRRAQYNPVETPNVAINVSNIVCDFFQVDTNFDLNDCTVGR